MVVIHTAYCLSDNPQFIDYKDLNLGNVGSDKIIYINGHGSKNKIAKRSIKNIAKILVEAGYRGEQNIYITSCSSKNKIAPGLKKNLISLLIKLDSSDKKYSFKVESFTEDGSITLINEDNKVEQYEIKNVSSSDIRKISTNSYAYKKIYYTENDTLPGILSHTQKERDILLQTQKEKIKLINLISEKNIKKN